MTDAKIRLDPDLLTPRDLRRARTVLKGRNPFELLDDPIDRVVLITWCLRTREDPSFTWDQAEDTPFSVYEQVNDEDEEDEEVPTTPGPATSNASEPGMNGNAALPPPPHDVAPVSNSSSTSG